MKKIYTHTDLAVLEIVKSILESEGIKCFIKNAYPPAAGEITPSIAWPELWLMSDDDFQRAQHILNTQLNSSQHTSATAWQCPICNERLEAQFNICWNCGYQKEEK